MSDLPTTAEWIQGVTAVGGAIGGVAGTKMIVSSIARWLADRQAEKRAHAEAALRSEEADLETVKGLASAYRHLEQQFEDLKKELAAERKARADAEKRAADAETGKFLALSDAEGRMAAQAAQYAAWKAEFNRDFNKLQRAAKQREEEARRVDDELRSGNQAASGRYLPQSRFDELDTLPPPREDP